MTDRSPEVLEAVEKINAKWPRRIIPNNSCSGFWEYFETDQGYGARGISDARILALAKQPQEQGVQ